MTASRHETRITYGADRIEEPVTAKRTEVPPFLWPLAEVTNVQYPVKRDRLTVQVTWTNL